MKITFKDFISERYIGPGRKIGFNTPSDDAELFNINFLMANELKTSKENTENLKKLLDYYDIDYSNFNAEDSLKKFQEKEPGYFTQYSFNFNAYNQEEATNIIKNIVTSFDVVPDSISSVPVLPWEKS